MACFLVSLGEAAVVMAAKKGAEQKEKKGSEQRKEQNENRIPFSRKLKWLTGLLVGGAVLLAFEHVWHGEIVAWFPFLTAMASPEDTSEMLHEMATVGVCMAVLVTAVWGVMCAVADAIVKRPENDTVKSTT